MEDPVVGVIKSPSRKRAKSRVRIMLEDVICESIRCIRFLCVLGWSGLVWSGQLRFEFVSLPMQAFVSLLVL